MEGGYAEPLLHRFEPAIYEASSATLLRLVRGVGDEAKRVMLVGHNPGLQELAMILASPDDQLAGRVSEHYPTAAFSLFELPVSRWSDVEPNVGRLILFIKPRQLP